MAKPITLEQKRKAVQLAATEWLNRHRVKGKINQSAAARAAKAQGTPIEQTALSWASRGEKIGETMAERVAALFETTPEGLVAEFIDGVEGVALRNVPGWARAKAEAMEEAGKVEAWVWNAIDSVEVPSRLRSAEKEMVIQMATFLDRWGQVSGLRIAAKKAT